MYVADVASVSLSSCLESANLASGLPEVARPLSWVSSPSSADGWLLCRAHLVCRRESGTAHRQLGRRCRSVDL